MIHSSTNFIAFGNYLRMTNRDLANAVFSINFFVSQLPIWITTEQRRPLPSLRASTRKALFSQQTHILT